MAGKIYMFQRFTMVYDEKGQLVTTAFPDNNNCVVATNKDHVYHAKILGIKAEEFNLLHEISHHIVGFIYGHDNCPIVWASAHNLPMPENADDLEWKITALSYFAMQKPMRHDHEWGAIRELSKGSDVWAIAKRVMEVFNILKDA